MFWDNFQRRITAIAILLEKAEEKNMNNIAKSAYYRSAVVLITTIVEGLVYLFSKELTKNNGYIINNKEELRIIHTMPYDVFKKNNIVIAEKSVKDIHIDNDDVPFKRLNDYLKKQKVINNSEYKKLEYVRRERNRIHFQELNKPDIGYTKLKVNKVSEPIDFLTKKLETLI